LEQEELWSTLDTRHGKPLVQFGSPDAHLLARTTSLKELLCPAAPALGVKYSQYETPPSYTTFRKPSATTRSWARPIESLSFGLNFGTVNPINPWFKPNVLPLF
jgi:hypothetical protein